MTDIAQTIADLVNDAALNQGFWKYSMDRITEPGQTVDTGYKDIFNAPILEIGHD